jgi:Phage tail tube protein, GTA-gp10
MANRRRGEVACRIGGRLYPLRLTLGALAEIEDAFAAGSLAALGERLGGGGVTAGDLGILLTAALNGAGARLDSEEVGALVEAADLPGIAAALAELFAVNFGEDPERP